jgi:hypothetical protein
MYEEAGSIFLFIDPIKFVEGIAGPVVPDERNGDFNATPGPLEKFFIIANCIATETS